MIKKLITKNPRCNLFYFVMPWTAVTQQHTHKIVTLQLVVLLLFVKREVYRCDCLQFLIHFYSQVLFIGHFNFNFSSQYVLLELTSCNTSNIMCCTAILCHKLVLLVLVRLIAIKILIVRLIAIKIFNRPAALFSISNSLIEVRLVDWNLPMAIFYCCLSRLSLLLSSCHQFLPFIQFSGDSKWSPDCPHSSVLFSLSALFR